MGRSLWSAVLRGLQRIVPGWEAFGLCWGSISIGAVSLRPVPSSDDDAPVMPPPAPDITLAGPPSGHPERVDPSVPLSEVERALWSQLT